jgi:hypothetical protein
MAGFQQRKVFCQSLTRRSKRPCRAKGYPTANGKFLCMFHGGNNIKGFNQKKYTHDTRIKALSKLKQFRDKTIEQVTEYYNEKVKPRIGTNEKSRYYYKQSYRRKNPYRNNTGSKAQPLTNQLDEVLRYLKKKQGTE